MVTEAHALTSPIYLLVTSLRVAFLLGLLREQWRPLAYPATLSALAYMSWLSGSWLIGLVSGTASPADVLTVGTEPMNGEDLASPIGWTPPHPDEYS